MTTRYGLSASPVKAKQVPAGENVDRAKRWLTDQLSGGTRFAWDLDHLAREAGIDPGALSAACVALDVVVKPGKPKRSPWSTQSDESPTWELPTTVFLGWQEDRPSEEVLCLSANPLRTVHFQYGVLKLTNPEEIAIVRKLIASGASYTEDPEEFLRHVPLPGVCDKEDEAKVRRERLSNDHSSDLAEAKRLFEKALEGQPAQPSAEEIEAASQKNRAIENERIASAESKVRIQ